MTLEELQSQWAADCQIDKTEVGNASLHLSKLNEKYSTLLSKFKAGLKKAKFDYDTVYLERYTFFTEGPSKEQVKAGMELPPKGKILKAEVERYLNADPILFQASMKLHLAQEKVDFTDRCLSQLNRRGFEIGNFIKWHMFLNGAH